MFLAFHVLWFWVRLKTNRLQWIKDCHCGAPKASSLQNAILITLTEFPAGKLGSELLEESLEHLTNLYPHVQQIHGEKVLSISGEAGNFTVTTNKSSLQAKIVVIAIGAGTPLRLKG